MPHPVMEPLSAPGSWKLTAKSPEFGRNYGTHLSAGLATSVSAAGLGSQRICLRSTEDVSSSSARTWPGCQVCCSTSASIHALKQEALECRRETAASMSSMRAATASATGS